MKKITFIVGQNPETKEGEIPIIVKDKQNKIADNHCKITYEGDYILIDKNKFVVEDLNTTYGTFFKLKYKGMRRIRNKRKLNINDQIYLAKRAKLNLNSNKIVSVLTSYGFKKRKKYKVYLLGFLSVLLYFIIGIILKSKYIALTIAILPFSLYMGYLKKMEEKKYTERDNNIITETKPSYDIKDIPFKIEELASLKEQGIITEEEFLSKKKELMDQL